ncbi:MAG: hypothetical protein JXQ73_12475 [Phycisphaerae bacterium]|nr:hypothetical protein [Phycisphaerae bacterium]
MRAISTCCLCLLLSAPATTLAFNGHEVTTGPLTVTIPPLPPITQRDQPVPVEVRLKNNGQTDLAGQTEIRNLVDSWHVLGPAKQPFKLPPGKSASLRFQVAPGKGAFSDLYPIHAYATFSDGQNQRVAHAVRIIKPTFKRPDTSFTEPPSLPVIDVPEQGIVPLWRVDHYRAAWQYFDRPPVYKPLGWQGSDPKSKAVLTPDVSVNRGTPKRSIGTHPPYAGGKGTIFAEYRLALPKTRPLRLMFDCAIRDHADSEPPSDGVTFRVSLQKDGKMRCLFERHTDSKTWIPAQVDLSDLAGQTVVLRLESDPGPKRDTTCDQAYWGEPRIVAGNPVLASPFAPARQAEIRRIIQSITTLGSSNPLPPGKATPIFQGKIARTPIPARHGVAFRLGHDDDACVALVQLGHKGLIDGLIGVGGPDEKAVVFDGLTLDISGDPAGDDASPIAYDQCKRRIQDGRLVVTHHLHDRIGPFDLTATLWADGPGLRIKFDCDPAPADKDDPSNPRRITDLCLGPANAQAPRVYYGHGYCIVNPKGFGAHFGGHNMSTSHVGFDFDTGLSLVQAVDNPPDRLEVQPDERRYELHSHMNATLTLVPGTKGAFDCAIKYRDLYDKRPAAGVTQLAGRFSYDIWGGSFAAIAERIEQVARYGCTDAILTIHNWQRWGYDYRLPDIFPPNPSLGTLQDLQQVGQVCRKHGLLWGLHDNYTDFYPDADDYSYKHICFSKDGTPRQAWYNRGRDAQSYRWRADHIMPFLQRNVRLVRQSLQPNHYFIDVLSSIGFYDYYDVDGRYHTKLETRRHWRDAFQWVRQTLGDNAPTTSEAGHDQLTGYLDGADCQFLTLSTSPKPTRFMITMKCDDWERTPWYDAVLHDKFILHGVGYDSRYRAERSRSLHGIVSDDYIAAEVLTGHPAMVDAGCWNAATVRKYWLLHDVGRHLALRRIREVLYVDDDIHRQRVTWDDGTRVWVNRGPKDWTVNGRVLPQYGYLVEGKDLTSAIERIDGVIVERTQGPIGFYCNARTASADSVLRVRPSVKRLENVDGNRFRLLIRWDAGQTLPDNLRVFLHFASRGIRTRENIAFQGDHTPKQPTQQWRGSVITGQNQVISIPKSCKPGKYDIVVGLHNRELGRQPLLGKEQGSRRYLIGTLIVEGSPGKITAVRLDPLASSPSQEDPRINLEKRPIDFGPVLTDGAVRIQKFPHTLRITPLPDSPPFTAKIRLPDFGASADISAVKLTALDERGATIRTDTPSATKGTLEISHKQEVFEYEVKW